MLCPSEPMKRHGQLFDKLVSWENLLAAERAAYRGKRFRPDVAAFHFRLEPNLLALRRELVAGEYQPGAYYTFQIRDPKPRLISAAPYRDRVVHHAVCRVIEPLFDRTFVHDSYACRPRSVVPCGRQPGAAATPGPEGTPGYATVVHTKGTHAALDRCTQFCRRYRYVLKCDVVKFFPSMDHEVLRALLERKLKCRPTLDLLQTIIDGSNPQEPTVVYFPGDDLFTPHERRRGIPIGNLTSQFFANVMLNPLDHFVKETRRVNGYVRYADDFLAFGDDKRELHELLGELRAFLVPYRLKLHDRKCVVLPVRAGVPFLGWKVFPDHRRIKRASGLRFQRKLRTLRRQYARGEIELSAVRPVLASYLGHLKHGDTHGLRRKLLRAAIFRRSNPSRDREGAAKGEPRRHVALAEFEDTKGHKEGLWSSFVFLGALRVFVFRPSSPLEVLTDGNERAVAEVGARPARGGDVVSRQAAAECGTGAGCQPQRPAGSPAAGPSAERYPGGACPTSRCRT